MSTLGASLRKLGLHLWDLAVGPLMAIGGWRYGKVVGESCETGGFIEAAFAVVGFFIIVITALTWWREQQWPRFMSSAVLHSALLTCSYNLGLDSNQHYYVYVDNQTSDKASVQIGPYALALEPGTLKRIAAQHGPTTVVIRNESGTLLSTDEIDLHRNDQILINVDAQATYYRGEVTYTSKRYSGLGGMRSDEEQVIGRIISLNEDYIFTEPPEQIEVPRSNGVYSAKTYLRR